MNARREGATTRLIWRIGDKRSNGGAEGIEYNRPRFIFGIRKQLIPGQTDPLEGCDGCQREAPVIALSIPPSARAGSGLCAYDLPRRLARDVHLRALLDSAKFCRGKEQAELATIESDR